MPHPLPSDQNVLTGYLQALSDLISFLDQKLNGKASFLEKVTYQNVHDHITKLLKEPR